MPFSTLTSALGISLILLPYCSQSQTRLSGQVQEETGKPLAFANVLLLNAKDSALVKGMVASDAGIYSLDGVLPGSYVIAASVVGYKKTYSPVFTVTAQTPTHQLLPLIAVADAKELNEVKVTARKPLFEQQMDRLVINVQSMITAQGGTALDVLERSPGIQLNRQQNVLSMNGKSGVMVMINGKLSRLPMDAVLQMLSGMNAGNIEKIELITTPPAKYDAEGDAGLINIVLKKNSQVQDGTNGSYNLTMGYGWYERPAAAFNINHRSGNLNLYGDYSFTLSHNWQEVSFDRKVSQENILTRTQSTSDRRGSFLIHTARAGFEYALSTRTTFSGLLSGFDNQWEMIAHNRNLTTRQHEVTTSVATRNHELNHWRHLMGNLNLRHQLADKSEISIDLDRLWYYNRQPTEYTNNYTYPTESRLEREEVRIRKETPFTFWVVKADYARPLRKAGSRLEIGAKSSIMQLTNDLQIEYLRTGAWQSDPRFSQDLTMNEAIWAAYANVNHQFSDKWKMQAGIRLEHTRTHLASTDEPDLVNRSYTNLFPGVFLQRELTKMSSLQLSYSRRITRPPYRVLAPIGIFYDPSTIRIGNPAIRPTLSDIAQLVYRFRENYLLTVRYSRDQNLMFDWQPIVDSKTNQQIITYQNFRRSDAVAFMLAFPTRLTTWWQMQTNLLGAWQKMYTGRDYLNLTYRQVYGQFTSSHTFKLHKSLTGEVVATYNSPSRRIGIFQQRAYGSTNLGLQHKISRDRGTLSFNVTDVFWTSKFVGTFYMPEANLDIQMRYLGEPRVVRLTYTRNFGNQKVKVNSKRTTGSEDERNRAN